MGTTDLNEFYGVTVRPAEKQGREYVAKGEIFRRDDFRTVEIVSGTGAARSSAERRAVQEARMWVAGSGEPEDWKKG
ncbi:MAG: hypothetical protein ACJ8AT_18260 [Hyalangium sp.]|uniref:hypothetical protein n=1 Tax=Hyalangium sp. TaxID=2028555 RepID=UPI003899FA23